MKKTALLFGLCLSAFSNTHAQSIGPATLNAAGGTAVIGANELDWSVGEMTMVSTFTATGIVVTQGLLQPDDYLNEGVVAHSLLANQILVFPNPATSVVNIQYTSSITGLLEYRLLDVAGQVISTQSVPVVPGVTAAQLNVSALACASYMLQVTVNAENSTPQTMTYKIQKLN